MAADDDMPTSEVSTKEPTTAAAPEEVVAPSADSDKNGTTEDNTPANEESKTVPAVEGEVSETTAPKTETDVDADSSNLAKLESDIIRQIEYYFGDANLNRDKFLQEQISKDEGWVPLSVLLSFKRLAALSTDPVVIVNALAKSDAGLIEISEDKLKLRRHPERPLPTYNQELRKDIISRTAYVKGFPLETEISQLIDFFKSFDKVLNINMRKYFDKPSQKYKFKGSVFVTFEDKEQVQKFIDLEKVCYNDRPLLRKLQADYFEEKRKEIEQHREEKKLKIMQSLAKNESLEEEKLLQMKKGTVLHFQGAGENVTREVLREAVLKVGSDEFEIAYVDYSKGEKEGHLRFSEENKGTLFLDKLDDKKLSLPVDDIQLELRLLNQEEEVAYLQKARQHMKNRRCNQNKNKRNFYQGNRKRRGGNENHDNKKKKVTSDA